MPIGKFSLKTNVTIKVKKHRAQLQKVLDLKKCFRIL